jgi:hypothetical protein
LIMKLHCHSIREAIDNVKWMGMTVYQ